jgi:hypothetical protein
VVGLVHERRLIAELWDMTPVKAALPYPLSDGFMDSRGPIALHYDDKRAFQRYYLRSKGVLKRVGSTVGVYTKDVSRQGVGFMSPVALNLKERIRLMLASAEVQLEITRCQHVDEWCYDCGGRFVLDPPPSK